MLTDSGARSLVAKDENCSHTMLDAMIKKILECLLVVLILEIF